MEPLVADDKWEQVVTLSLEWRHLTCALRDIYAGEEFIEDLTDFIVEIEVIRMNLCDAVEGLRRQGSPQIGDSALEN